MRGRALAASWAVLASSLLIGCTDFAQQMPRDFGTLVGPPPAMHADGVPAHGALETPAVAAPVEEPTRTKLANAIPAAVVRPPLRDVRELIGLERHELQDRLGDPALRRRDAPAEIWQYRSSLCVLDLFLYRDGQAVRVTNAELRPRDGRELPAATCLSSL
jgi:hypothetical protein